jgi:hypothetical protein
MGEEVLGPNLYAREHLLHSPHQPEGFYVTLGHIVEQSPSLHVARPERLGVHNPRVTHGEERCPWLANEQARPQKAGVWAQWTLNLN